MTFKLPFFFLKDKGGNFFVFFREKVGTCPLIIAAIGYYLCTAATSGPKRKTAKVNRGGETGHEQ